MKETDTTSKNDASLKMGTAVILTRGLLDRNDAKTGHGLIRGTDRFDVIAVIDEKFAGRDAGEVLDGIHRGIPVYESVRALKKDTGVTPDFAVIGVAISGGRLNEAWQTLILDVIAEGISIVNGMHMFLSDIPAFVAAAEKHQVKLIDFRRSKPFDQLAHWCGDIFGITTPTLAVLGTDCALGKRTTCRIVMELCRENRISAEMIYTGQTGWLQGYPYGFILDATPNDFVSGELEAAVVACSREVNPDLILLEGQSSLRNPLGPCGSEFLVSANAKGVVLQHAPFRPYFDTVEEFGCRLPAVEDEIRLVEMYGAKVIAVTLNGEGGFREDLVRYAEQLSNTTKLPVLDPLHDDLSDLVQAVRSFIGNHNTPTHEES